jgi:hypothetical protein
MTETHDKPKVERKQVGKVISFETGAPQATPQGALGSAADAPSPLAKNCGACRWFDADYAPDDDPADALGLCGWPADRLPYSLRYGNRERMAVSPIAGEKCSCFERRLETPVTAI